MNTKSVPAKHKGQEGFLLLEVLLAIVIFSIGILGVLGLQAVMVKHSTEANLRSIASLVAEERISEMWADPANAGNKVENATNIEPVLPNGRRTVVQPVAGRFEVTVEWRLPDQPLEERHRFVTVANITGG